MITNQVPIQIWQRLPRHKFEFEPERVRILFRPQQSGIHEWNLFRLLSSISGYSVVFKLKLEMSSEQFSLTEMKSHPLCVLYLSKTIEIHPFLAIALGRTQITCSPHCLLIKVSKNIAREPYKCAFGSLAKNCVGRIAGDWACPLYGAATAVDLW